LDIADYFCKAIAFRLKPNTRAAILQVASSVFARRHLVPLGSAVVANFLSEAPMLRIALASALSILALPALAQSPCGPITNLTAHLAANHNEAPVARGVDAAGRLLLMYVDPASGTWTAVVAQPDGLACIVSTGTGWEAVDSKPTGRPS